MSRPGTVQVRLSGDIDDTYAAAAAVAACCTALAARPVPQPP